MFKFWRFFKRGYSSTISITLSLGDYNMLKISQTAPRYDDALNLLIDSLETIGTEDKSIRLKLYNYVHQVFGKTLKDLIK